MLVLACGQHALTVRLEGVEVRACTCTFHMKHAHAHAHALAHGRRSARCAQVIGSPLAFTAARQKVRASTITAGKSRSETLYIVAAALGNVTINWGFTVWEDFANESAKKWGMVQTAAKVFMNAESKLVFNTWHARAVNLREMKRDLISRLSVGRRAFLRVAYQEWQDFAFERTRKGKLVHRAANAFISMSVLSAFTTWFDSIDIWKDVDDAYVTIDSGAKQAAGAAEVQRFVHSSAFRNRRDRKRLYELRVAEEEAEEMAAQAEEMEAAEVEAAEVEAEEEVETDEQEAG